MFSTYTKIFFLLLACFFFLTACNDAAMTTDTLDSTKVDSIPPTTIGEDTPATLDTMAMPLPDTATIEPVPRTDTSHNTATPGVVDTAKKSATLGISFYDKMRLHEIKPLSVYVSIVNGQAVLKREIRNREEQRNITQEKNDTSVIHMFNINIYERLTVRLNYDSTDFAITPLNNETQSINTTGTTRWMWNVKAISTKERSSTITVVLDPQPRAGTEDDLDPVIFNVKIRFSFWDMVRSWIVWLADNPQVTITTILVPAIAWLFARRRKQRPKAGDTDTA